MKIILIDYPYHKTYIHPGRCKQVDIKLLNKKNKEKVHLNLRVRNRKFNGLGMTFTGNSILVVLNALV